MLTVKSKKKCLSNNFFQWKCVSCKQLKQPGNLTTTGNCLHDQWPLLGPCWTLASRCWLTAICTLTFSADSSLLAVGPVPLSPLAPLTFVFFHLSLLGDIVIITINPKVLICCWVFLTNNINENSNKKNENVTKNHTNKISSDEK